jgi:mono/diheme cytochrome c family protein
MHVNKQTLLVMLLGVALLAVVLFVATTDSLADDSAKASHDDTWKIPGQESKRENPVDASKESIDYGELIFSSQCTMCHGKAGDGSGDLVERLELTMPDLTDATTMDTWTDGDLFYILTQGHERMPSQKDRLKDKVKWDIINYVRTFSSDG